MKKNLLGIMLLIGIFILPEAKAQTTYEEMERLTVNEQVTTVITASEPVRFVDISTDKVVGDQPIDNIVRLKPKEGGHEDGEVLAIVTIVTERYRTQALVLEAGKTFRHGYRNVVVVRKMTFPNDKVLTIEMTEKQISGRNISLNIDYEDVLSADSFSASLLEEE